MHNYTQDVQSSMTMRLVSLDTTVGLAILAKTAVLGRLVVLAAVVRATWGAAALSTFVTGLVRVDLALGEF